MHAEVRMARIVEADRALPVRQGDVRGGCRVAWDERASLSQIARPVRDWMARRGSSGSSAGPRVGSSGCRWTSKCVDWVIDQYATRYFPTSPSSDFHEEIAKRGFVYSYAWTRMVLYIRSGLVRLPSCRLGPRRKKRVRRPLPGMMVFQDGSTHEWLWLGQAEPSDLIVTRWMTPPARSTRCSPGGAGGDGFDLAWPIRDDRQGGACSPLFYTDRGSHYFLTPRAGEKVSLGAAHPGRPRPSGAGHPALPPHTAPRGAVRMERVWRTSAGPAATGPALRGDRDDRGGQPVPRPDLHRRPQRCSSSAVAA